MRNDSLRPGLQYAKAVAAEIRGEAAKRQVQQKEIAAALGISEMATSRRMTGKLPFAVDDSDMIAALRLIEGTD